jgi:hypothetical protein
VLEARAVNQVCFLYILDGRNTTDGPLQQILNPGEMLFTKQGVGYYVTGYQGVRVIFLQRSECGQD